MTPSHEIHRKSRIKRLISNGVRCPKRLTNFSHFFQHSIAIVVIRHSAYFQRCVLSAATINQIRTRRFTPNNVSIGSQYAFIISFDVLLLFLIRLVESRDDYMLWLNLCLFLCLEACKTIQSTHTCDLVHETVAAAAVNESLSWNWNFSISFSQIKRSHIRAHVLKTTKKKAQVRSRGAQTKVRRETVRQPTIPRAKWNIIGCLSSNERMLVAEARLLCFHFFPLLILYRRSIGRSMRAFAETPADLCLVRRKFSRWMTIYGRSHASKYIKPQWHKTDRFQLFTISFAVAFRCSAAAVPNESASISRFCGVLILYYCHRPPRPFNCFHSVRKQAIMGRKENRVQQALRRLHYALFWLEAPPQITKCASTFARFMCLMNEAWWPIKFRFCFFSSGCLLRPIGGNFSSNRH